MADVEITIRPTGPYVVTGPIVLRDGQGNEIDVSDRGGTVKLCRCGGSTTKPFCDGTHSAIGFMAATSAVTKAE
ncbi:MAG: CDGSH iron-sulfur domain-containing protein [Candidatus Eremiobacteraeota bacterium]|nr:CDGSH iron-sulfur domain-containing protein [Candidatus Eremiobacteraeota bacterium]